MKVKIAQSKEVKDYITGFPKNIQHLLEQIRSIIIKTAPGAEEVISYGVPAYKYHGVLVFFAGYENHIGFYPTPSGIEKFRKELLPYKSAKGSVQFPVDQPLPIALLEEIVQFRAEQNLKKSATKTNRKK